MGWNFTARGIAYADASEPVTPLESLFETQAQSVDAALDDVYGAIASEVQDINNPPRCHAYLTSDGGSTNATWTTGISLTSELYDENGDSPLHPSSHLSRVYARRTGMHYLSWGLCFAAAASNVRAAQVRKNAGGVYTDGDGISADRKLSLGVSFSVQLGASRRLEMADGDYLELFGTQNSGGSVDILAGSASTFLQLHWVGE